MGSQLRVGIIGCGMATKEYHIPAIKSIEGLKLEWVCDVDKKKARAVGNKEGVDWYNESKSALADSPNIINVSTPPSTHKNIALDALEAGSNVLIEKPTAETTEEVDEIINAADSTSKKVSVVHNNLYFDPFLPVLKSVNQGEFGEIISIRSFIGNTTGNDERDWSKDSVLGPIGDRLPHPIYLVTHFMDEISDRFVRVQADDIVDGVSVQIDDERRFGYIEARQSAIPAKNVEIIGTKKRVELDLFNYTKVEYDSVNRSPVTMVRDNIDSAYQILRSTGTNGFNFVRDLNSSGSKFSAPGHYHLMKEFRRSILEDTEPPVSLEDGRKVVEILNDVEKRAKN